LFKSKQEDKMSRSVIIIGGGLTGLAAGSYLRMNGYYTSVFEMHSITGGVCTGWKRKDYIFDGAMNWLVGTRPGTSFYSIWEELGATGGWKVFDHDRFMMVEGTTGKTFNLFCDIDRLEQHMLELGPEDADVIHDFAKTVRDLGKVDMPVDKAPELYGFFDMFKMIRFTGYMGLLNKWKKVSTREFSQRFKNPVLREAFGSGLAGDSDVPMLFMLFSFAWLNLKMAGYLIGGGLELARRLEKRYLGLGGQLHTSSRVSKILVENNKAVGIRLDNGNEFRADIVISAADGHTTLFDMLEGKYIDGKTRALYENPQLFPPLIYISLGISRPFNEIPASVAGLVFPLQEPLTVAGKENKWMGVLPYSFDPSLAPAGKTVLRVQFSTDFDYWKKLSQDPVQYKAEKEKIIDQVIAILDKRYPGLAASVEARDIASPVTWERYTGNWQGSYEGWLLKEFDMNMRISKTLPGLANFYMAGQWVEPGGGMPTAAMSGRNVTQIICAKDKKKFVTSKI
jgi:phytoene dehydrogenase-like protein